MGCYAPNPSLNPAMNMPRIDQVKVSTRPLVLDHQDQGKALDFKGHRHRKIIREQTKRLADNTALNQNDQNKTPIEVKTSTKDITRYTRRTPQQPNSTISKQTIRHDTQQD